MTPNNSGITRQQPVGSGFNYFSTANDVINGIDLTGKNAIITGGYAGIGLETTRALTQAGGRVIIPARDIDKARKNLAGISNVEIEKLDLIDPASIDAFAEKFLASQRPLHLLINNAGIMWVPLRRDQRGYESQLATNYLGQFQLTARLWPALKKANGARVINVSSFGHHMSAFNFDDPNFERREYETLQAYGQSKTASNLFAVGLDKRSKQFNVRAYSLHPGAVSGTDLAREASTELFKQIGIFDESGNIKQELVEKLKTMPQGAATTVWCATSPMLDGIGGVYCEDADIAEIDTGNINHRHEDPTTLKGVMSYSIDESTADQLWTLTEKMTGVKFQVN